MCTSLATFVPDILVSSCPNFFLLRRQRVRDRHATLAEVLATNDGIVDGECGTSLLPKAKYVWFTKTSL